QGSTLRNALAEPKDCEHWGASARVPLSCLINHGPECSADGAYNVMRIKRLAKICIKAGSHGSFFVFGRRITSQCDYRSESSVLRIAFLNGFQQLIAIGGSESYIRDHNMGWTPAKSLNGAVGRLRDRHRSARLL